MKNVIKQHQRIFAVTGAALLLGAAGAIVAADLEKPSTKENVSIQFPKDWTLGKTTGARNLLVALAPKSDRDDTGEFQARFFVTQDPGEKLDAGAQQARLAKDKDFPGYKAVEPPTPITVGGLTGAYFGGTFTSGSLKLRSRQYLFTQNNQIYIITVTSLASRWAGYLPQIEASVATFSVKK